jgi:hypothetical protein
MMTIVSPFAQPARGPRRCDIPTTIVHRARGGAVPANSAKDVLPRASNAPADKLPAVTETTHDLFDRHVVLRQREWASFSTRRLLCQGCAFFAAIDSNRPCLLGDHAM